MKTQEIAPYVACLPVAFVNVYFVGTRDNWVLIDSGLPHTFKMIQGAANELFGDAPPSALLLTHGHFDHSGAAQQVVEHWDVPIYAQPLEMPYLSARSSYPPPDPTVGGAIAFMSRFMPASADDLSGHLQPLPEDGSVPFLDDWRWIFTPGHAPGHVSFFRESDRTLIAGDALATEDMDKWGGALFKRPQKIARSGTPFVCDWGKTRQSAQELAPLQPRVLACGHGIPMSGENVAPQLEHFAANFPIPAHGRYVQEAAQTDENGIVSLPPPAPDPLPKIAAGIGATMLAATLLKRTGRKS